jgi:hypothetical protein
MDVDWGLFSGSGAFWDGVVAVVEVRYQPSWCWGAFWRFTPREGVGFWAYLPSSVLRGQKKLGRFWPFSGVLGRG